MARWWDIKCVAFLADAKSQAAVKKFDINLPPVGIFLASRRLGIVSRDTVLNIFIAGLISLFLLIGTSKWRFLAIWPLLRSFGEISYGVYLTHMVIFDLVDRWMPNYLSNFVADA